MDLKSATTNELCEWFTRGVDCHGSWYRESLIRLVTDWKQYKDSEEDIKANVCRWLSEH